MIFCLCDLYLDDNYEVKHICWFQKTNKRKNLSTAIVFKYGIQVPHTVEHSSKLEEDNINSRLNHFLNWVLFNFNHMDIILIYIIVHIRLTFIWYFMSTNHWLENSIWLMVKVSLIWTII